jgi:hypothetical protein
MSTPTPELSVVLATSALGAAMRSLGAFRAQTAAGRIEVLLVAPRAELERINPAGAPELGALRSIESASPFALAQARARGVLAARAPWVFIGETHSFADPTMVAQLLAAIAESPAESRPQALVPCIYNVNPGGAVNWASFLIDYGAWGPGHAGGATIAPPIYNGVFARAMLEQLGDDLPKAMSPHDDSVAPMPSGRGYLSIFVPSARIGHLNVVRLADFVRSKAHHGMGVGVTRAKRWSWPRRLAYAAAAPLIGAVLFGRTFPDYRLGRRGDRLPVGVLPLLALGALVRAAGEAIGYLGWSPAWLDARLDQLEIHKADYVPGWGR